MKKRLGSYPSSNVIFSITTALFTIGLFGLFSLNTSRLTKKIKEEVEVQVLLKHKLTAAEKEDIADILRSKSFISGSSAGSAHIRFRSKEAWAEEVKAETGEDFVRFLGGNPLRDAYLIRIKTAHYNRKQMGAIKTELAQIKGVFEIAYAELFIFKINENIRKIGFMLAFFTLIFLVTVVVLIHSAIKLALFSQRFLIRSMQLVGASGFFIQKPFLITAWWHGFFSGFLASGLLSLLLFYVLHQIEALAELQNHYLTASIFVSLMIFGGLLSLLSAYLATTRYLRMNPEELY